MCSAHDHQIDLVLRCVIEHSFPRPGGDMNRGRFTIMSLAVADRLVEPGTGPLLIGRERSDVQFRSRPERRLYELLHSVRRRL